MSGDVKTQDVNSSYDLERLKKDRNYWDSLAPPGATHYVPDDPFTYENWMKKVDGRWHLWPGPLNDSPVAKPERWSEACCDDVTEREERDGLAGQIVRPEASRIEASSAVERVFAREGGLSLPNKGEG